MTNLELVEPFEWALMFDGDPLFMPKSGNDGIVIVRRDVAPMRALFAAFSGRAGGSFEDFRWALTQYARNGEAVVCECCSAVITLGGEGHTDDCRLCIEANRVFEGGKTIESESLTAEKSKLIRRLRSINTCLAKARKNERK